MSIEEDKVYVFRKQLVRVVEVDDMHVHLHQNNGILLKYSIGQFEKGAKLYQEPVSIKYLGIFHEIFIKKDLDNFFDKYFPIITYNIRIEGISIIRKDYGSYRIISIDYKLFRTNYLYKNAILSTIEKEINSWIK